MDMSDAAAGLPLPPEDAAAATLERDIRRALVAVAVLVFGLLFIAAVVPIGGAVIGTGKLGVESRVKRISHPAGGVIAQIFVRNGSRVKAGDPLVRFDDNVTGSQSELSALSVHQLLAQRARLEAERVEAARVLFPAELTSSPDPGAAAAMRDEARLFVLRRSEQTALRAQLSSRVVQLGKQIAGYEAQIASLRTQAELIEPERAGVKALWEKGLVTITRRNELERTAVSLQGSIGSLQAQIAQTQAQITEAQEQLIQLGQSRRAEAGTQLAAINNALIDQQMRRVVASDSQTRSLVRATYAGVVNKLVYAAVGEVVRPAEPIMEIVPDADQLIVEAVIAPVDVDQVRRGQSARVRFSGINSSASPEIPGKVIFVSPDETTDPQSGMSYFSVRVEVSAAALKDWPELELKAGMPAEVYIETGNRSMLSYCSPSAPMAQI